MEIENQALNHSTVQDFAYWIGVVQTDGYLQKQNSKSGYKQCYIRLGVGDKSLPMLKKFIVISRNVFGVKGYSYSIINHIGTNTHVFGFGCNRFITNFETLQIDFKQVTPPDWILERGELFGAYLAGVIDGDGDTRISRPKYPQCYIRVYSGHMIDKFINSIKTLLDCGVFIEKRVRIRKIGNHSFFSRCFTIEFRVSSKNLDFFKKYVVDNIAIDYKKKIISNYIELKER